MRSAWDWDRLERHTKRNEKTGCLEWQLYRNKDGYGQVASERTNRAHRLAYLLAKGPIPPGMCVCHSCDNRACVEPQHLHLGTHDDNMMEMKTRGRACRKKQGTKNGFSKLTEHEVREIRTGYESGQTQAELALSFKISPASVSMIVRRIYWSHVGGA